MKGLAELAKACAPEDPAAASPASAPIELSEEMIDKIAECMISKLQSSGPKPAEQEEEDQEDPGEDPEEGENENDT